MHVAQFLSGLALAVFVSLLYLFLCRLLIILLWSSLFLVVLDYAGLVVVVVGVIWVEEWLWS